MKRSPCEPRHLAFYRDSRQDIRRVCNGLGFMLVAITASLYFLVKIFLAILPLMGYQESQWYAKFGSIEPSLYYLILGSVYALSLALPCLVYIVVYRPRIQQIIPSRSTNPVLFLALFFIGLALCLFANVPGNWISNLITQIFHVESSGSSSSGVTLGSMTVVALVLSVIRSTVMPAFFEEFVFRGILMSRLYRFGTGFAIFASALLFGFFHGNLSQIPFAFLVGLVLGYLVARTENIWLSVLIHFANNAIATLPEILSPFVSSGTVRAVSLTIFCVVFFLAILSAIYVFVRFRTIYIPRFPLHPLPLRIRMGGFFSSAGIIVILVVNIGETIFSLIS